jgi:uncharacterized membrane protein YdjX (TVP38/TMEM64 family)
MHLRAAKPLLPFLAMVAVPVIIAALLVGSLQGWPFAQELIAGIRDMAGEWWAIPLLILLYVVFALLLLPVAPLSAAAALAWGWAAGGAIDLAAATLSAIIPFYLARGGLSARVQLYLLRRGLPVPHFTPDQRAFALLMLRLVPILPFAALNYLCGLARFRTREYVIPTFVGMIPSSFLFAWFVDTMGAGATGMATQLQILAACCAIAAFAVMVRWLGKGVRRRWVREDRTAPPPEDGGLRSAAPELPLERTSNPTEGG